MAQKYVDRHIKFYNLAEKVIQVYRINGDDSIGNLVNQIIIDRGIADGIITLEETKDSPYSEKKTEYKIAQQQTRFETALSQTCRLVAEYSTNTEKVIRELQVKLREQEKMLYEVRDLINSQYKYAYNDNDIEFCSADKNYDNYEPHILIKKSDEVYQKMQERYAVEKANDAKRSSHT